MKEIDDLKKYYAEMVSDYEYLAGYEEPEAEKLREEIKKRWQTLLKGHKVFEIACGTGYWTWVIAEVARHLLAIDINENMLALAQKRRAGCNNVSFILADAYALDNIQDKFTAAFAHWWWSHIPRRQISQFLKTLHSKLQAGAIVLFSDHLPDYCDVDFKISYNKDGDRIEERIMKNGRKHYVVKNFLTEKDARNYLSGITRDIQYTAYLRHWELVYRTK